MKLEDILDQWKIDAVIDKTELTEESVKIPLLHHKYLRMMTEEALLWKKVSADYKKLYRAKWEYYLGTISDEELQDRGWKPNLLKILRADINIYMDSDNDLVELKLKMEYQEQKVKAIEDIIRSINNRNFTVKNGIDWAKFQHGG